MFKSRKYRVCEKVSVSLISYDNLLKNFHNFLDRATKRTGRRQDWSQIRDQLEIYFEERLCDWNI